MQLIYRKYADRKAAIFLFDFPTHPLIPNLLLPLWIIRITHLIEKPRKPRSLQNDHEEWKTFHQGRKSFTYYLTPALKMILRVAVVSFETTYRHT
jgi:hypothetical protein